MHKLIRTNLVLCCTLVGSAAFAADADVEFFEKKIRPVLVEHCYSCHSQGAKRIRAELLVDTREALLKGGESGPALVPGNPEKSLLIRAMRHQDDLFMPPSRKLPDEVIADFVRWVQTGAADPRQATASVKPRKEFRITPEDRKHWSFQPVGDVQPPPVQDAGWARSPLDRFVVARLQDKGLQPSVLADRYTLLRRLHFDLIGLPPTVAEIDAFVKDESPQAVEKVVDGLLASKEFGVRWGRHWLDGVRYASDIDKSGRYRDWVVRSLNDDLPYDEFIRLQIAGDLIPTKETDPAKRHVSGASLDGITATGMLALATFEKVGRDLAVAEIVDSQIDVTGRQILGLTLACARCHDHKFDPIATQDYYALAGIFFSSHISPGKLIADGRLSGDILEVPLLNEIDGARNRRIDEQIRPLAQQLKAVEAKAGPAGKLQRVREQLKALAADTKIKAADKKKKETPLLAEQARLLKDRETNGWSDNPPELAEMARLETEIAALVKTKVVPVSAIAVQEGGVKGSNREKIADAPVHIRGDFRKLGVVVPRRFPIILAGEEQTPLGQLTKGSGRLELANWVASADNPLTARVAVNRTWLHLFGDGLVRTPDNFGLMGERPTHPELLDYLTRRFIASSWSVKQLIREMVLSSTYQQSSFADAAMLKADPENRLLGRMSRKRIEYEAVRDSVLFASGQLGDKATAKRTLYDPILRAKIDQTRMMFDGPDPLTIMPERATTTTTTQALFLMNNPFVPKAAETLAARLQKDAPDEQARVNQAYLRLLGRPASTEEIAIGQAYAARSSWTNYLQVLMCTNEFVYLD